MHAHTLQKYEEMSTKCGKEKKKNTHIIGMPSNTSNRRIMFFPDKFTDPPVKG